MNLEKRKQFMQFMVNTLMYYLFLTYSFESFCLKIVLHHMSVPLWTLLPLQPSYFRNTKNNTTVSFLRKILKFFLLIFPDM